MRSINKRIIIKIVKYLILGAMATAVTVAAADRFLSTKSYQNNMIFMASGVIALIAFLLARYNIGVIRKHYRFIDSLLDSFSYRTPQDNIKISFRRLTEVLNAEKGALLVSEKGNYRLLTAIGFDASEMEIPEATPYNFENGNNADMNYLDMNGIFDWEARSIIPIKTAGNLEAVGVFSSDAPGDSEILRKKLIKALTEQLSMGLDHAALKLSYRNVRMKLTEREIENRNLRKELKRKVYDIHSLFNESSSLYTILNEEKLLNSFLLMIVGQLGLNRAAILYKDPERDVFTLRFSRGVPREKKREIKFGENNSLISRMNLLSGPVGLDEVGKELPERDEIDKLADLGFKQVYRLTFGGTTFGFLLTGDKMNKNDYLESDLKLMTILVNMLTSALENITNYTIIEELSFTDSLTGLYNYRYFYKRLNEEIFRARRYLRNLALVIFDIDDFKIFNDTYGHQAGDSVLRQLGAYLRSLVRSIDIVCRYGGEEFCIIMQEIDLEEVGAFVERLRNQIESFSFDFSFTEKNPRVTVSVGVAVYPTDADNADKLIYCADMALLSAKGSGKNAAVFYANVGDADFRANKKVESR